VSNTVEAKLGKGALIPAGAVGLVGLFIATLIKGRSGFYGGLLAQALVVIFFVVHLLVSKYSAKMDPIGVMVMAMLSYFAKIIILGALFLIVLQNISEKSLNRASFGIIAICVTVAWLTGEVRAFFRLRAQLPLPNLAASDQTEL
jgi:ATP synthase protein I